MAMSLKTLSTILLRSQSNPTFNVNEPEVVFTAPTPAAGLGTVAVIIIVYRPLWETSFVFAVKVDVTGSKMMNTGCDMDAPNKEKEAV